MHELQGMDSNQFLLIAFFGIFTYGMYRVICWVGKLSEKYQVRLRLRRWRGNVDKAKRVKVPRALERKLVANAIYDGLDSACDKGVLTAQQVHRWCTKISNEMGMPELMPGYDPQPAPLPDKKRSKQSITWVKDNIRNRLALGVHAIRVRLPGTKEEAGNKISSIFKRLNRPNVTVITSRS